MGPVTRALNEALSTGINVDKGPITGEDMDRAITRARPSVSAETVCQHEEWHENRY